MSVEKINTLPPLKYSIPLDLQENSKYQKKKQLFHESWWVSTKCFIRGCWIRIFRGIFTKTFCVYKSTLSIIMWCCIGTWTCWPFLLRKCYIRRDLFCERVRCQYWCCLSWIICRHLSPPPSMLMPSLSILIYTSHTSALNTMMLMMRTTTNSDSCVFFSDLPASRIQRGHGEGGRGGGGGKLQGREGTGGGELLPSEEHSQKTTKLWLLAWPHTS